MVIFSFSRHVKIDQHFLAMVLPVQIHPSERRCLFYPRRSIILQSRDYLAYIQTVRNQTVFQMWGSIFRRNTKAHHRVKESETTTPALGHSRREVRFINPWVQNSAITLAIEWGVQLLVQDREGMPIPEDAASRHGRWLQPLLASFGTGWTRKLAESCSCSDTSAWSPPDRLQRPARPPTALVRTLRAHHHSTFGLQTQYVGSEFLVNLLTATRSRWSLQSDVTIHESRETCIQSISLGCDPCRLQRKDSVGSNRI